MVQNSLDVEDTKIYSYIEQDAKRWQLTRLLNDWDPSSLITPTIKLLSWSPFQVLTAVWMKSYQWSRFLRLVDRVRGSELTDWIELSVEAHNAEEARPSSQLGIYLCAS